MMQQSHHVRAHKKMRLSLILGLVGCLVVVVALALGLGLGLGLHRPIPTITISDIPSVTPVVSLVTPIPTLTPTALPFLGNSFTITGSPLVGVFYSPVNNLSWVVHTNNLYLLNTSANAIIKTISPTRGGPSHQSITFHPIAITSDGASLLFADLEGLYQFSTLIDATLSNTSAVPAPANQKFGDIVISANDAYAYVGCYLFGGDVSYNFLIFQNTGGNFDYVLSLALSVHGTNSSPGILAISSGGSILATKDIYANVYFYSGANTGAIAFIARIDGNANNVNFPMIFSVDGTILYSAQVGEMMVKITGTTLTTRITLPTDAHIVGMCLSPQGEFLFLRDSTNQAIHIYSTVTLSYLSSILGIAGSQGLSMSPDGTKMLCVNGSSVDRIDQVDSV